ncbi:MAG: protein translocase subunit SecD [Deltaproteobacteria bacterium]|nr:MAG: protein translocase subunit SecD [Deltaproteobacteria bacterium]
MIRGLRFRVASVALVVLFFGYLAAANLASEEARLESWYLPDEGLRLGLDLQGGISWVLSADLDASIQHELDHVSSQLERGLEDAGLPGGGLRLEGPRIVAEPDGEAQAAKLRELVADYGVLDVVADAPGRLEMTLTDEWQREVRDRGMAQVLEVMRRRIDDPIQGIQDSVVTRQGEDRLLVQIPGGQISQATARKLIEQTGFLEFKIVIDQAPSEELLRGKYPDGLPEDTRIVFERDRETRRIVSAALVARAADITGDYLSDARVGFDPQQRPLVNFTFNSEGGRIFAELTEKNIGNLLGIILDDELYSAPVIRSRIASRGQITGRFTTQEARDLAVVLRAGSFSIPVQIEENRTVGPALGADSIRSGTRASLLALLLILIFTAIYYRIAGTFASVALVVNLLLIFGIMSAFRATLTLPGIAGLVLTVGMAIDANVIIFERIREELRTGKTPSASIDTGFNKALWTILDANITTLITAIVLFEYGTGPIKGFAVTLSIGILTSLFAALVVTRLMFTVLTQTRRLHALSI